MKRLLALPIAFVLAMWVAGSVSAVTPAGTVTVETNGCTFTVHIHLEQQWPVVGWKIKVFNAANWNDGLTIFKGSGQNDANGDMTVGPFTTAEGHYNAIVDNEFPPDGSSIVKDFFLSCPAQAPATPTPTPPQAPATPTPTPTATGQELPAQGTPPPTSGQELPAGGVGGISATPPPTDATGPGAAPSDDGARTALMGIAGLIAAALFLARAAQPAAARARSRRNR